MTARLSLEPVVVAGGTQEEGEDEAASLRAERDAEVPSDQGDTDQGRDVSSFSCSKAMAAPGFNIAGKALQKEENEANS